MDAHSFLVSVLSVLVATLIGYQIYTVINFDRQKRRLRQEWRSLVETITEQMALLQAESNNTQSAITGDLALYYEKQQDDFRFVNYTLTSAMYILRNGNNAYADNMIKSIMEYGNGGLEMSEHHKSMVLRLFYSGIKPVYRGDNADGLERMLIGITQK